MLLLLGVVSYLTQGTSWLVLMAALGATVGIPMGLTYPFPIAIKIALISGLIASITAAVYGFRHHLKIKGQILAVVGIVMWSFIGVIGLGTGT